MPTIRIALYGYKRALIGTMALQATHRRQAFLRPITAPAWRLASVLV